MKFKILTEKQIPLILPIVSAVNEHIEDSVLEKRLHEMFNYKNYICFGLFKGSGLVAVSSGWILTKLYSGLQLELDNVTVEKNSRGNGVGSQLTTKIEEWAKEKGCLSIELNSYITNDRSHKFYFNHGYRILGYHFQKKHF